MSIIDLTLERIQRLARHLPAYTRPTCHIAGTTGKGSVSALVSSMLSSSTPPLSVGRFNGPHLVSVNDCIVINNHSVSTAVYEEARAEVGMGGRPDATDIIPDGCVLAFLGTSVSAIAAEKAAIARRGTPFVLGCQLNTEVETVVGEVVTAAGAGLLYALLVLTRSWDSMIDGPEPPFSLPATPFAPPPPLPVRFSMPCFGPDTNGGGHPVLALLPLHGEHQLDNLAIAVSVVSAVLMNSSWTAIRGRFSNTGIARGIKSVQWPGRLSFHTLNSPPLLTLAAYISELVTLHRSNTPSRPLSLTYILGLSHLPPKTPRETLAPLLPFDAPDGLQVDVSVALLPFTPPDGLNLFRRRSCKRL
ncbi:Mur ligase [Mycena vitilis]|nr:Mur ligase [Mycena vitilis]